MTEVSRKPYHKFVEDDNSKNLSINISNRNSLASRAASYGNVNEADFDESAAY